MICIVSVLHQNEGSIGKFIPDAWEISWDPRDLPRECAVLILTLPILMDKVYFKTHRLGWIYERIAIGHTLPWVRMYWVVHPRPQDFPRPRHSINILVVGIIHCTIQYIPPLAVYDTRLCRVVRMYWCCRQRYHGGDVWGISPFFAPSFQPMTLEPELLYFRSLRPAKVFAGICTTAGWVQMDVQKSYIKQCKVSEYQCNFADDGCFWDLSFIHSFSQKSCLPHVDGL